MVWSEMLARFMFEKEVRQQEHVGEMRSEMFDKKLKRRKDI
jgi:hypothetical protein